VALSNPADDPFTKLAQNLGELEVVIGERARPAIAGVRERLRDALACRERGDMAGSIRRDSSRDGAAGRSRQRARSGRGRSDAGQSRSDSLPRLAPVTKVMRKTSVDVMRRKAGDTKDDDKKDW